MKKLISFLLLALIFLSPLTMEVHAAPAKKTLPQIEVYQPDNNTVSFDKSIYVNGKIFNANEIWVNGRKVSLKGDGSFSTNVRMPFFGRHYIKLEAYNSRKEKAIKYLKVTYKKPDEKPRIIVLSPKKDTKVGTTTIIIKGFVENISKLFLDKKVVNINRKGGKQFFEKEVKLLVEGQNHFVLKGFSYDNQEITEELFIERVATYQPGQDTKMELFFPVDNYETKRDNVAVKGKCTNIKRVYINDKVVKINKNNIFYKELPLQFGSNTIEIIGVDQNEVPIKIVRTVIRLTKDLAAQKKQVLKLEQRDAHRKYVSFDHIFDEKNRLEEKFNDNLQKTLGNIIGANKILSSALINLNTEKIKKDQDTEYDGKIRPYLKSIDVNIVLDGKLKGKKETVVKKIINDNLRRYGKLRKNIKFSYENFTATTTSLKLSQFENLNTELILKKQEAERKIQEFFQNYFNQFLGEDRAYINILINIDKERIKKALIQQKKDILLDDLSNYTAYVRATILLDKSFKKPVADNLKAILSSNINNFGDYSIQTTFIHEEFAGRRDDAFGLLNPTVLIALGSIFVLMMVTFVSFFRERRMEKRYSAFLEKMQSMDVRVPANINTQSGLSSTDQLSNLMKKYTGVQDSEEKRYFSFINEKNIHKLKLVLAVQIGQDQASVETIAIIISYLEPHLASSILMLYPPKIQAQVIDLIVEPKQYEISQVESIEKEIEDLIGGTIGGKSSVLAILENVSQKTTRYIFKEMEERFPETFAYLKPSVYIFEDILGMSDKNLEVLFREIDPKTIATAISAYDSAKQERVFSLLAQSAKGLVLEWLELKGKKLKEHDIEEAKKYIISIAKVLEGFKEISIDKRSEE